MGRRNRDPNGRRAGDPDVPGGNRPPRPVRGLLYLSTILRDLSPSRELERETNRAVVEEQQRIGQELHDGVGQELTGLALMADMLQKRLRTISPPDATLATTMSTGLERVREDIRGLSRGLVPVEVDPEGLRSALQDLAASTGEPLGGRVLVPVHWPWSHSRYNRCNSPVPYCPRVRRERPSAFARLRNRDTLRRARSPDHPHGSGQRKRPPERSRPPWWTRLEDHAAPGRARGGRRSADPGARRRNRGGVYDPEEDRP